MTLINYWGRSETKEKGVSAIIGVILMVMITVAIAATVYVYIEQLRMEQQEEPELYVEGTATSVVETGTYSILGGNETWPVYTITLKECECNYQMLFRTEDAVVPPTNTKLRFFYDLIELGDDVYYDVYRIKSL